MSGAELAAMAKYPPKTDADFDRLSYKEIKFRVIAGRHKDSVGYLIGRAQPRDMPDCMTLDAYEAKYEGAFFILSFTDIGKSIAVPGTYLFPTPVNEHCKQPTPVSEMSPAQKFKSDLWRQHRCITLHDMQQPVYKLEWLAHAS